MSTFQGFEPLSGSQDPDPEPNQSERQDLDPYHFDEDPQNSIDQIYLNQGQGVTMSVKNAKRIQKLAPAVTENDLNVNAIVNLPYLDFRKFAICKGLLKDVYTYIG